MSFTPSRAQPRLNATIAPWLDRRGLLINLCLRWTQNNLSDAEDLLGEACLRVLEAERKSPEPVDNPIGLWATIIANLGRDRRRRVSRHHDDETRATATPLELDDPTAAPDSTAHYKQVLSVTLKDLDRVPTLQREALALRGVGFDYSEIALQLDVSTSNARKLVQLARDVLRCGLEEGERPCEPTLALSVARRTPAQRRGRMEREASQPRPLPVLRPPQMAQRQMLQPLMLQRQMPQPRMPRPRRFWPSQPQPRMLRPPIARPAMTESRPAARCPSAHSRTIDPLAHREPAPAVAPEWLGAA